MLATLPHLDLEQSPVAGSGVATYSWAKGMEIAGLGGCEELWGRSRTTSSDSGT